MARDKQFAWLRAYVRFLWRSHQDGLSAGQSIARALGAPDLPPPGFVPKQDRIEATNPPPFVLNDWTVPPVEQLIEAEAERLGLPRDDACWDIAILRIMLAAAIVERHQNDQRKPGSVHLRPGRPAGSRNRTKRPLRRIN